MVWRRRSLDCCCSRQEHAGQQQDNDAGEGQRGPPAPMRQGLLRQHHAVGMARDPIEHHSMLSCIANSEEWIQFGPRNNAKFHRSSLPCRPQHAAYRRVYGASLVRPAHLRWCRASLFLQEVFRPTTEVPWRRKGSSRWGRAVRHQATATKAPSPGRRLVTKKKYAAGSLVSHLR